MENWIDIILKIHIVMAAYMAGVAWFVQINHYPLFRAVSKEDFPNYQSKNILKTIPLTFPPMIAELITGAIIYLYFKTDISILNLLLIIVLWISTFTIQVPTHFKLKKGFDEKKFKLLLYSNWLRVAIWSIRAFLVLNLQ